jgi:hypothetical protein
MSFVGNGGTGIYIYIGATQNWAWTWYTPGWQGNTMLQPQPTNTPNATLSYTTPTVTLNPDGTYSFNWSVTNPGLQGSLYYDIQTSSS